MGNGLPTLLDLSRLGRAPDDVQTLGEEFDALEQQKTLRLERFQQLVAQALAEPDRERALWREVAARSAADGGRELHSRRGDWFAMLDSVIAFVRAVTEVADKVNRRYPEAVPEADRLPGVLRELEQSRDLYAERWHDEDDVAEMVRSTNHPIRAEQLRELVKKYPPPPAWYDEPQGERPW